MSNNSTVFLKVLFFLI